MNDLSNLRTELAVKRREARREYKCHFAAATLCRARHVWLGGTAAIASLLAGSAFLSKITNILPALELLAPALSLLAAGLMATVTFNRFMETAEKHYSAGRLWEQHRDAVSALLLRTNEADTSEFQSLLAAFEALSARRLEIRREAIGYSHRIFKRHEFTKDKVEIEDSIDLVPPARK